MTVNNAVRVLQRLRTCEETDACDIGCDTCQFNDDKEQILTAIDMAMDALKEKQDGRPD